LFLVNQLNLFESTTIQYLCQQDFSLMLSSVSVFIWISLHAPCEICQGLPALHQNITSSRWFLLVMKAIVLIKQYDTKQYDVEQYDIF
jgi:hypothetical protein